MSQYTTGEIARLCGVTVRTVQYYDTQDIINPSELSEGGRRIYSEEDLRKMRLICTLRNLGLSLDTIRRINMEPNSRDVIETFLTEQVRVLKSEIREKQDQEERIKKLLAEIGSIEDFSLENIDDIASNMDNNKKMHKAHVTMVVVGVFMDILEISTLLYGIIKGVWIPFLIVLPIVAVLAAVLVRYYYKSVSYICPVCHKLFKPGLKEFFFARHTRKTRKLTCTECGSVSFCIETDSE
ncbi:MAG: MerR family transcriptional regulator [Eubacteriaceae bacterium]|jgi:DNA-binding transcriptional MerR regulator/DNA-directed RNA polymerase subunit RPC12/RpoP|nr:MerR family transcriptional regulator [Eubacteriaceae bacterium]